MEERKPWDRMESEPELWYNRFRRFLLLFPKRSVTAVFAAEQGPKEEKGEKGRKNEPSGRWYEMAQQWKWEERAEAWDKVQYAEEEKLRARVLRSGWALDHQRILSLTEIAQGLQSMMADEGKVWVADVKSVGTGPDAERVDLVQFNDALFKEFREYLTDIAEEVGGRVKKSEVEMKNLPKIYLDTDPNDDGVEP